LAFDALAALVFCNYCRTDVPKISEWVGKTFQGINIGPSDQFFKLLATHHTFEEIEGFGIDELAKVYPAYIRENAYVKQYEVELVKGLQILQNSDFVQLWNNDILPILNRQCNEAEVACNSVQIENVLVEISRVRQKQIRENIHIYITYFTHPASFQIASNSYITNSSVDKLISVKPFLRLFVHELCHGFSNEKAKAAYRNMRFQDTFFKKTNWFLNKFCGHPGDEEEFVQAIEHYIAVRNGLETYDDAIERFRSHYKCSVPIAVIMFDELCKLEEMPKDMNVWICEVFFGEIMKHEEIENKVNAVVAGYTNKFLENWGKEEQKNPSRFVSFKQI